jgi:hypothetical protein
MAVTPLLALSQFRQRREMFMALVLSSLGDLMHNYQQFRDKLLNVQKVAGMLEVSVREAKELYPKAPEVHSLLAIMEAIVYSREPTAKKLELCLEAVNTRKSVSANELIHIIQLVKGRDDSIENKIKAILQSKIMKMDEPILKSEAYELVLEFSNKLMI